MTELRIPLGRYARRVFWTVVVLACLLLVGARFVVVPRISGTDSPSVSEVVDQSLGDVLATVLAATVLSAVVVWLTRPSRRPTDLAVVHPKDIGPTLENHLANTRTWWYSGSAGRWNRARVLGELAKKARSTNTSCDVVLSILDPREESACEAYAEHRRGARTGSGKGWSLDDVRKDVYATIVAAAVLNDEQPLLNVEVNLKKATSLFRIDASDDGLVVTREDPKEPALVCEAGGYFYDAFRQSMVLERNQGKDLVLTKAGRRLSELDVATTRSLLQELGLETPDLNRDEQVEAILREARSDDSPY